jgi:hypothetical protein
VSVEISSDGAVSLTLDSVTVSFTEGASFASPSILLVSLGSMAAAVAVTAYACAAAVEGVAAVDVTVAAVASKMMEAMISVSGSAAVADAAAGVLVGTEMSSDGAVLFTEGASSAAPSISLVSLGLTAGAAVGATVGAVTVR